MRLDENIIAANCINCGHRDGDYCLVSGRDYTLERKYQYFCKEDFTKWTPKQKRKGFLSIIKSIFIIFALALLLTSCATTKQQRTVNTTVRDF